jgi:hypothetical protein
MFRPYVFVILITPPVYKIVTNNLKIILKVPEGIFYVELFIALEGHVVVQLVEALRLKPGRWRIRFPVESFGFFIDIILPDTINQRSTWPLTEMRTMDIA